MAVYPNASYVLNPYSYHSGNSRFGQGINRTFGHWRNRFDAANYEQRASTPVGYGPGEALVLAQSDAGMATTPADCVTSTNTVTGVLWATKEMSATLVSNNTISANAGLVVALAVSMLSANNTNAALSSTLALAANLASQGNIAASLSALAFCVSTMTSDQGLSTSNLTGTARMEANLTTEGTVVTANACAVAVWNALAAQFNTPGTMGEKVNSPGGITLQNIRDAMALATSAMIAAGSIDDKLAVISAKTDNLPASPANEVTVASRATQVSVDALPTAAATADAILGRNLAGGSNGGRTVKDALRSSRNKVEIVGNVINVYAEDDTTIAWTGTIATEVRDALQEVNPG